MLTPIGGPPAWRGAELLARGFWPRRFTGYELELLDAALAACGHDPPALRRQHFHIPLLEPLWTTLGRELENGAGVVRLSGIAPASHSAAQLRRLFWGICVQLGTPLPQNAAGDILAELRDQQGAARAARPPLHTENCDLLALFCARGGVAGGVLRVVSSIAIHDEIARLRPELLHVLYRDFWRHPGADEQGPSARPQAAPLPMPIFARGPDGAFTGQYSRQLVEMAHGRGGISPLSVEQMAALDLLDEVADALCIEAAFTPGDVLVLNQHVTFHGRTPSAAGQVLLRMWLWHARSRALPPGHAAQWGSTAAGALRGGAFAPTSAFGGNA